MGRVFFFRVMALPVTVLLQTWVLWKDKGKAAALLTSGRYVRPRIPWQRDGYGLFFSVYGEAGIGTDLFTLPFVLPADWAIILSAPGCWKKSGQFAR